MPNIKILIVEDEPIIAQNLKQIIGTTDFSVIGIAYNSTRALDYLSNRSPDIVLLDIRIKGTHDGIDLAQVINQKYKIPFIYITSHSDKLTLERAKQTLPYGYIVKPFKEKDLIAVLEMAIYRHAQMNKLTFAPIEKINHTVLSPLTNKEYELLEDVFEGMTNRQIGEKHGNTINTIKFHLKNVFAKLDVKSRTAAIAKIRKL